jgi:ABC-type transport system substrate-binding protein
MMAEGRKRFYTFTLVCVILFMAGTPALNVAAVDFPGDLNVGPYVDKVIYKMVDNQFLALLSGEIDFMTKYLLEEQITIADQDPDISLSSRLRNGYGHFTINCGKYPLNLSAFRRAFAFAFDKTRVTKEIQDGFSREHDSMVPYANSWCIEDDMPYHYYTAQIETGNQILNGSGFTIDPGTGYRLAPDGSELNVVIEYPSSEIAGGTCQIGVDALRALHVNAETRAGGFQEIVARVGSHGDYDMVFYATDFVSDDVDWLAYEYWSEYADMLYMNPTNFANETFDSWREQLLYSTSYEEVYEAAAAMQLILHENVPRVVAYQNTILSAYRTDVFTGQIQDFGRWIGSQWTLRKIHKIDGTRGGTVSIGFAAPETFNLFLIQSNYAGDISINLWPSLYSRAPDISPWRNLADRLLVETHSENQAVQEGHTRFTIDIIRNATWSDETPLTAEDVAFTFTYLLESSVFGNPVAVDLVDLVAAYAPTPHRVVLEFNSESWWHFSNFAYDWIIPRHIFNNEDGIGYANWDKWNPVYDQNEVYITSGPFELTDWVIGEFYELSANPDFCYFPSPPPNSTTTTTTPTTANQANRYDLVLYGGVVGAAVVTFVGGFILLRKELPSN